MKVVRAAGLGLALLLASATSRAEPPAQPAAPQPEVVFPAAQPAAPAEEAPPLVPLPAPAPAPAPAPVKPQGKSSFTPDPTLLYAGGGLFMLGYVPPLAVALPSTAGLAGRILLGVVTVGLVPLACALGDGGSDSYVCNGDHGTIQLLMPVAGPFLFAENHPKDTVINEHGRPLAPGVKGVLYAAGAAQAAGMALVVGSFVLGDSVGEDGRPSSGKGAMYGGAIMLGSAYALSLATAIPSLAGGTLSFLEGCTGGRSSSSICDERWNGAMMALPIVGPFVLAGTRPRDSVLAQHGAYSGAARALLIADGAVQAGGLALLLGGLAARSSGPSLTPAPLEKVGAKLHILPMTAGGSFGLTASLDGF